MARQKKSHPEYLSFTRQERIGIVVVVLIMMVYPVIPVIYVLLNKPGPVDHTAFEKEIAELNIKEADSSSGHSKRNYDDYSPYQPSEKNYSDKPIIGELFYFDPNTLAVDGWKKLGVRDKTANTIQNYISKGGRFYRPEDIGKIWGLHEDEVKRLLPYVRIEQKPAKDFNTYQNAEPGKTDTRPKYSVASVDINKADTSAFIALPGIGCKLAARIVAFREKLGGFYKVEQVAETYGLPDSTFQKIKSKLILTGNTVKQFNINNATLDELKTHPYLRYNIANAMIQYRVQHGNFSSVSDIKKIMAVTDEIYNKAAPYLTVK